MCAFGIVNIGILSLYIIIQGYLPSFFLSKPLGCYGYGGALFTNHPEIASTLQSLRLHGRNERDKFSNIRINVNSRLDTVQSAVLLCKPDILADEMSSRQVAAPRYTRQLQAQTTDHRRLDTVLYRPAALPQDEVVSAWSAYTIRTPDVERPHLQKRLNESSIDGVILYPKPVYKQAAYRKFPVANGSCPEAELASLVAKCLAFRCIHILKSRHSYVSYLS